MGMSGTRRVKAAVGALTVALVPLALGGSGAAAPVALVGPLADSGAVVAGPVPASRTADRGPAPQVIAQRTVLVGDLGKAAGKVAVSSPKGTRVWSVSALSGHGLPVAAERAYRRAAATMARTDPGCGLPWTLLAGIGRVESDHGRYGGALLGADGVSRPRIIGIALDGAGPVAAIHDTDHGRLDGDKVWDRAVGPMQFIPATWASSGRDGDGDGRTSPHDLDDAAAAAAAYLCSGGGNLRDPGAQAAAIYRYNQDDYYVALVQAFEVGYRTGVFVIPAPPAEEAVTTKHKRRHQDRAPARKRHRKHRPSASDDSAGGKGAVTGTKTDPAPKPTPTPTKPPTATPSPKPSPKPSPSPAPPEPTTVEAALTVADGVYSLGGKPLDLGVVGQLATTASGDFDGDGAVETNQLELDGMVGKVVTMVVVPLASGKLGIYSINGISLA
jgi:membrane-bound lytic murein transglycosylase B